MRLATRFFATHAAAVLLTAAGSLALLYFGATALLEREARAGQLERARAFARAAAEAKATRQDIGLLAFMRQAAGDQGVLYLAYGDPARRLTLVAPAARSRDAGLRVPPSGSAAAWRDADAVLADGARVREWSLREPGGAWMRVGLDAGVLAGDLRARLSRWALLGALSCAGAVALGGALALWLAGRLTRPLKGISQGTREVREGRLGALVEAGRRDEIGDLARDFNAMSLQLKELDAMKRDFISGVTHDLGTPLVAIRDGIHYLQTGQAGPLTERQAEYLLLLSNSSQRLSSFVGNLLTEARIEAGKVEPYFEAVDAAAELGELAKLYRPLAEARGLQLSWTCTALDPTLYVDVVQFREMVINLLSNALKFTPSGRISLNLAEDGDMLAVTVSDTGIGISPEHHAGIFERFFRVRQPEGSPARQGSGLGLAIVKGLAEAHRGGVSVDSKLGEGATFTLRLPRRAPAGKQGGK